MSSTNEQSLELHKSNRGKIEIKSKVPLKNKEDLSLAYTPGVAEPCRKIAADKEKVFEYTNKGNTVAIVTDGTAVLGLGNIGPEAALPVMEGKAVIFKEFAGIDAIPICLNAKTPEEIIRIVKSLEPNFAGINLEDIAAPACFLIEETLKKEMNIPVMHDDQHGTAIVVLAGLMNALRLVNKNKEDVEVVVSGAGAAGTAVANLLLYYGFKNILVLDSKGIIVSERGDLNDYKKILAEKTNLEKKSGGLKEAVSGADVFIGVSAPGILSGEMTKSMKKNPIIFALSNPTPEIMPDEAYAAGAAVVASGRSDFPNQVNNALVYPGVFRGALDARVREITMEMKLAAAKALAGLISDEELTKDYIIPNIFDPRVIKTVSEAVKI